MGVILLASSRVWAGELLGLECRHFDGLALRIEQEVWHGKVLPPRTPNVERIVDLHTDAANLLKQFLGDRTTGYVLQTRAGPPMSQRSLMREFYDVQENLGISQRGFHAFRHYRNTLLRNSHCPSGLLKF
jgi:integrase